MIADVEKEGTEALELWRDSAVRNLGLANQKAAITGDFDEESAEVLLTDSLPEEEF